VLSLTADLLAGDPVFGGVRVEIAGVDESVPADEELLTIAFQNLLINAAQAMQGRGTISATVTAADERIQRVQIADTGPGLSAEARASLFKPFFTTKARGTGLGLATAKRLVEAHRGTIAIECPPGGGTIVTIELPRQDEAVQRQHEP
jgi:signal transduction histidine kinase